MAFIHKKNISRFCCSKDKFIHTRRHLDYIFLIHFSDPFKENVVPSSEASNSYVVGWCLCVRLVYNKIIIHLFFAYIHICIYQHNIWKRKAEQIFTLHNENKNRILYYVVPKLENSIYQWLSHFIHHICYYSLLFFVLGSYSLRTIALCINISVIKSFRDHFILCSYM